MSNSTINDTGGNSLPGNMTTPFERFINLMRNFAMLMENVIPAVVVSYDRKKNIVTCQPAINRVDRQGNEIKRALLVLPCFNPCGNGIGINFPLKEGDTGWVIGCDRDAENFKGTLKTGAPATDNVHQYAFGFFLPDKIKDINVSEGNNNALVIQTLDGSTGMAMESGRIEFVSSENFYLDSKNIYLGSNKFEMLCPDTVFDIETVFGRINKVTLVAGPWNLTGCTINIQAGDVICDGISLKNHVHLTPDNQSVMTGKAQ